MNKKDDGMVEYITYYKIPDELGDLLAGLAFPGGNPRPITVGEILDSEGKQ